MGDIYLCEPANNIIEVGKHLEERRNLVISGLHIIDGDTRGLAGYLHRGRRPDIRLRTSRCRRMFLFTVVIEAVYRSGGGRLRRG